MANALNTNFNYTYNGTLLTEVFFKPTVGTPALDSLFRILPGSKFKIQMPTLQELNDIIVSGTDCERTARGSVDLTNQTLELKPLKFFLEECAETFEGNVGNILAEQWFKTGADVNDISGTDLQRTINQLIEDAARRNLFKIASFGDTNSGSDKYDQLDGLWTTLLANDGSGTSYCVNKVASFGTGSLSAGEALSALEAAYEGADEILDQIPESEKRFYVTRSVYDNYFNSLQSATTGSDNQVTYTQDGIPVLRYRGVVVEKISAWDKFLRETDNPLNGTVEHLLLYTTKQNHVLGVENSGDLNRIRGWYSIDDDKYRFDGKMRVGYNYIHCDLQTIAY